MKKHLQTDITATVNIGRCTRNFNNIINTTSSIIKHEYNINGPDCSDIVQLRPSTQEHNVRFISIKLKRVLIIWQCWDETDMHVVSVRL